MRIHTGPCDCYECVGEEYGYDRNNRRYTKNNLKKHTQLEPCEECGRLKTEYRDLGRKGYYECWWCNYRVGDEDNLHFESAMRPLEEHRI